MRYKLNPIDHPQEFYRGKCRVCDACPIHKITRLCQYGGPFSGYHQEESMPDEKPAITLDEALKRVAAMTAPKVTKEGIEAKIEGVSYLVHDRLTIAIIVMNSGYQIIGKAAAASPENYDKEVGQRLAYDDAFRQIWALEGYLLKEVLAMQAKPVELEKKVDPSPEAGS